MITLGSRVKDTVTGYTGMATGRVEYLAACPLILIESMELDEQKVHGSKWFDEQRVELVVEQAP